MAGNSAVVVDDLPLVKPNLWVHDFIEIRDANVPTREPVVLPSFSESLS